jgi:hypothetical protein
LIPGEASTTSAAEQRERFMKAESEKAIAEIEQVLILLRRHL